MLSKQIWIYSAYPWYASTAGTSWITMAKVSGEKNTPFGEFVEVTVDENTSEYLRTGYIQVNSNGKSITVDVKQEGNGIPQYYNLISGDKNLVSGDKNLVIRK